MGAMFNGTATVTISVFGLPGMLTVLGGHNEFWRLLRLQSNE
jgi:hypothetical protein